MPHFDLRQRRLCLRVAYDGAPGVGKTTNVRQLAAAFSAQRPDAAEARAALEAPSPRLDWLELRSGLICGLPLTCQVVAVPGSGAARRRRLVAAADAVVFVCDSDPSSVARSRDALRVVADLVSPGGAPIVLQANKQDVVDALDPAALAAELGLPGADVRGAVARDGAGVLDTFLAAVRDLKLSLEAKVAGGGLRVDASAPSPTHDAHLALAAQVLEAEEAAEMFLEAVARELVPRPSSTRPPEAPGP